MTTLTNHIPIRDLEKFSMFENSPYEGGTRARLTWGERDGNPRVTVWPGGNTKEERYPIWAGINPETWTVLVQRFLAIFSGEPDTKEKMTTYRTTKDDYGNETKSILSEIWFGRDKEGVCWISLIAPDRPKIIFKFKLSDWHNFYNSQGEPFSEAEISSMLATGTIKKIDKAMGNIITKIREPYSGGDNSGTQKQSSMDLGDIDDF